MSGARLAVDRLGFRYHGADHPALDDLSLTVEAGERLAVLGPNGSGKTTFVLHLNGLLDLQEGSITIGDLAVCAENLGEIRRRVGVVFQDPDDQLFMPTVRADVEFGPANLGQDEDSRAAAARAALVAVRAEDLRDRTPHHLSGGEKRRVAIAGVLAMNPRLLVLDEPTSGLDPVGRRELSELLATLDQTQVMVTHDLSFALATCPRSVILAGGRIVADGPTRDLLADEALLAEHGLELPYGFSVR